MIDYIIIAIIAFSIIISLLRGFIREVMSVASWVVAFFVANHFYPYLANYLTQIESFTCAMARQLRSCLLPH